MGVKVDSMVDGEGVNYSSIISVLSGLYTSL